MPVPSVYSEAVFADDMVSWLGDLADVLRWSAGSPAVQQAVVDTLLEFGTTDITTVTAASDLRTLRALGRRAIWRAVVQATAGNYSFSSDGQRFDRQQVNVQAREMLKVAEADCLEAGGVGLSVGRLTLDFLEPASEWR